MPRSDFNFNPPETITFSTNKKSHPFKGGFGCFKKLSGFRRGRFGFGLGFGLRQDFFSFEITLTTFLLDRFVVLLAHNSLHSPDIPIWLRYYDYWARPIQS